MSTELEGDLPRIIPGLATLVRERCTTLYNVVNSLAWPKTTISKLSIGAALSKQSSESYLLLPSSHAVTDHIYVYVLFIEAPTG